MMTNEDAQQARHLQESSKKVVEQAFFMKRAMDHGDAISAINYAGEMLKELKTTHLSAKSYYELYMKVLDELRALEDFFWALSRQGVPMVELYERVQAQTSVLPRLYLMVTVGGCYIRSLEAPARDVLRDLVEMCKGVQHPMRGLFLRNYLAHVTKDVLPDVGSPYEHQGCTVQDSVEFVLENFTEANRLWVRMHHQGPAKDKKKRERERKDLRLLVGTNLVRLSQLEGVDVVRYKEVILPRVLEQVVACRDTVAQSYLMDCIIQVFPDDFHVHALDTFLDAVAKLKEKVRVRPILESLMERLANYVEASPEALPQEVQAFRAFNHCAAHLIRERPNLPLVEVINLQAALTNFAIRCYPTRLEYVNHSINVAAQALAARGLQPGGAAGFEPPPECDAALEELLSVPLRALAIRALELGHYPELLRFLSYTAQRRVSVELLRAVLASDGVLSDVTAVDKLLVTISPLLRDPEGVPGQPPLPPTAAAGRPAMLGGMGAAAGEDGAAAAAAGTSVEEEQLLVARMVHLFRSDDTDMLYRIIETARRHFVHGAGRRVQHTLVPLVFVALGLARRVRGIENNIAAREAEARAALAPPPAAAPAPPAAAAATADEDAGEEAAAAGGDGAAAENGEGGAAAASEGATLKDGAAAAADEDASSAAAEAPSLEQLAAASAAATAGADSSAVDGEGAAAAAGADQAGLPLPPPAVLVLPEIPPPPQYSSRKVFQFVHEVVTGLAPAFPWMSLRLFLTAALAGDRAGFKAIAYEFVSQAFIIYEDELTDSRAQVRALELMVGTLVACGGFDDTDYDALATKTAQYAAKLLKKPDQCRAVVLCSHLFWAPAAKDGGASGGRKRAYRDGRRVLECLQRALKIADACMAGGTHVQLFVEILDRYIYYFEDGNPEITDKYISGLIALIREHLEGMERLDARTAAEAHFRGTLAHLAERRRRDDLVDGLKERLQAIVL